MLHFPTEILINRETKPGNPRFRVSPRAVLLNMESGVQQRILMNKEPVDFEEVKFWTTPDKIKILQDFYTLVKRTNPFWFPSQLYNGRIIQARFREGRQYRVRNIANNRNVQEVTFNLELDEARELRVPNTNVNIVDVQQIFLFELIKTEKRKDTHTFKEEDILYDQYTSSENAAILFPQPTPILFSYTVGTSPLRHREYGVLSETTKFNQKIVSNNGEVDIRSNGVEHGGYNRHLFVSALSRELTETELTNLNMLNGNGSEPVTNITPP